jgi:hypothetical protein
MSEIRVQGRNTSRHAPGSRDESRITGINDGRYLHIYPRDPIVEKMKADHWTHTTPVWVINDSIKKVIGIRLDKPVNGEVGIGRFFCHTLKFGGFSYIIGKCRHLINPLVQRHVGYRSKTDTCAASWACSPCRELHVKRPRLQSWIPFLCNSQTIVLCLLYSVALTLIKDQLS